MTSGGAGEALLCALAGEAEVGSGGGPGCSCLPGSGDGGGQGGLGGDGQVVGGGDPGQDVERWTGWERDGGVALAQGRAGRIAVESTDVVYDGAPFERGVVM